MKSKQENHPAAVRRYHPSAEQGLTKEQVAERLRSGLINHDSSVPTKPINRIVRDNVCTLFNLINFILALAILLVGSYKNLLFMGVVLCNMVIGIFQEIRAKRTIDKLSILSANKAKVIRDGAVHEVDIYEVLLDDVLEYAHGNQIPTDSIVLEGECDVNESLVTGESKSIHKKPGDMLLSGSFLVSGHCRARAEHIGADNYVSTISNGAKYLKKVKSEIMESLNKIIKIVSILIIPTGILLFLSQRSLENHSFQRAVVSTAAALVGMIPEGLVLLTSTVLAVSVIRLSRHKVLVQELYCIEALARVDVLCLDKTGTITEGRMELHDLLPLNDTAETRISDALNALAAVMDDPSPTFDAIAARFCNGTNWQAQEIIPFSSDKKWSGASFSEQGAYVIGAPEFVMQGNLDGLQEILEEAVKENRVLLLAHSASGFVNRGLPEQLQPLAFLLVRDVIRPEAHDTLCYFAEQGVDIKVISGDNVKTVMNIAQRAGVANAQRCVDASTLKTEEDIKAAVEQYTVFGRVSPTQKKQMVLALKEKGHTVAMTGDGVNDVLALKEADCSVAMASGSDAARNVSQLVLLNSSFDSMPRVVAEGRRSINNIQRSASLFLVKTIYATILALLFLFIHMPYPFMPIQLTLTSMFTIGIPSFVLALQPNKDRIQGKFLRNVISRAFPGAFTIVINILVVTILAYFMKLDSSTSSTLCVILTGFTGLLLVLKLCLPFNLLRGALFGTMCAGLTLGVVVFHDLFSLVLLPAKHLLLLAGLMAVAFVLFQLMLRLFDKRLANPSVQK